jgi:tripartite-type tricarboxylate transporter receptor subunit TctC
VAQIGMIRRDLVERERWMSSARFNRLLAVMQALPGPEAHELCVHMGMTARGRLGGLLAGLGFMAPGFLLMLAAAPHGANPGLYDGKLPYDALRDFTPIVRATVSPVGFFVPASSPHRTLRDLADAARAQPGRLFAGSPGNGSGPHMVIELWNWKTGAKFEHLPMKGDAPLAVETVAARVDVGVTGLTVMKPHLESGRLRLLAVSSDRRFPAVPDSPTLAEAGFPAVDGYAWFGLLGPAGLPAEVVARVNRDANLVLAQAEVRAPLEAGGTFVSGGTPEQFGAFIAAEVEKWSQVARATGMKPD